MTEITVGTRIKHLTALDSRGGVMYGTVRKVHSGPQYRVEWDSGDISTENPGGDWRPVSYGPLVASVEAQQSVAEISFHPNNAVQVVGVRHEGDVMDAYLIPGLSGLPARDARGTLSVVVTVAGDLHVVSDTQVVRPEPPKPLSAEAQAYRDEWAAKGHANVYIPEALR